MEALFMSMGIVALAEFGDKTQLLALILVSRFKRPVSIISGIFFATLINHSLAAILGTWITTLIPEQIMRWALGLLFLLIALWSIILNKINEREIVLKKHQGALWATFFTFILAEMGDKTQIATIALTAHYSAPFLVITGTTLGMLLADVPVVFLGNKFSDVIPMKMVNKITATIFLFMGLFTLFY